MKHELTLLVDGVETTVTVERNGDRIVVEREGERHEVVVTGDRIVADAAPRSQAVPRRPPSHAPAAGTVADGGAAGEARAPMVGVVREIHARPGDRVSEGDLVVTMEAMKMDIHVNAPVDGKVTSVLCSVGDTTSEGVVLVTIEPNAGGTATE